MISTDLAIAASSGLSRSWYMANRSGTSATTSVPIGPRRWSSKLSDTHTAPVIAARSYSEVPSALGTRSPRHTPSSLDSCAHRAFTPASCASSEPDAVRPASRNASTLANAGTACAYSSSTRFSASALRTSW